MDPGSLRGSILSLSAASLGSGVLSLPYVLKLTGWMMGIFMICVGAFAAAWSMHMIVDSAQWVMARNYS